MEPFYSSTSLFLWIMADMFQRPSDPLFSMSPGWLALSRSLSAYMYVCIYIYIYVYTDIVMPTYLHTCIYVVYTYTHILFFVQGVFRPSFRVRRFGLELVVLNG